MSEAFSQSPPVYSTAVASNYSTPYQTSVYLTPKTALSISHSKFFHYFIKFNCIHCLWLIFVIDD